MPGGEDFVSFFAPEVGILFRFLIWGQEFCTEKSCCRGRVFDGKNSGPGVSPGDGNRLN